MRTWLVCAGVILLSSCNASEDISKARQGVAEFRERMRDRQVGAIYAQAAPEFRQSGPEEAALRFLDTVQSRLGNVEESSERGWNVSTGPGGSMVTLAYETRFTRGRGNEQFVFRVSGNETRLAGYNVNSMELIMNTDAEAQSNAAAPTNTTR